MGRLAARDRMLTPMPRLLLVGQAPGRTKGRAFGAQSASGRRLLKLAGLTEDELYALADVVNLVDYWPGSKAGKGDAFPAEVSMRVVEEIAEHGTVLFVGRAVCDRLMGAGAARSMEFLRWYSAFGGLVRYAVMPHPSGVNYWWNDAERVAAARRFLRRTMKEVQ